MEYRPSGGTLLSAPTGGRTFHVSRKTPLEAIFGTIQEEMRSQYGLGYKSTNPATDGGYRRLEVKSSKVGLKAQVRAGYYAARRSDKLNRDERHDHKRALAPS